MRDGLGLAFKKTSSDCSVQGVDLLLIDSRRLPCHNCFFVLFFFASIPFQSWQSEEVSISGPKIPQALEKILQLKEIRQEQLTDPTGQYSCILFLFDKLNQTDLGQMNTSFDS